MILGRFNHRDTENIENHGEMNQYVMFNDMSNNTK